MKRIVPYITFLGSILSIAAGYYLFYGDQGPVAQSGMFLMTVIALIFIFAAIFQEFRYSRKARYSEALHDIYTVFDYCMRGVSPNKSADEIRNYAHRVCDALANAFSLITGTRCAACIKVINEWPQVPEETRYSVDTLCRDANSEKSRSHHSEVVHYLDQNTDYLYMFKNMDKPEGGTFISNHLSGTPEYINSSFDVYKKQPISVDMPIVKNILRHFSWPLPYQSTIGAVIYPFIPEGEDQLVGFVCVDSPSRYVFKKRYDLKLLREVSGMLYPMMNRWCDLINRNNNQSMEDMEDGHGQSS